MPDSRPSPESVEKRRENDWGDLREPATQRAHLERERQKEKLMADARASVRQAEEAEDHEEDDGEGSGGWYKAKIPVKARSNRAAELRAAASRAPPPVAAVLAKGGGPKGVNFNHRKGNSKWAAISPQRVADEAGSGNISGEGDSHSPAKDVSPTRGSFSIPSCNWQ